MHVIRAEVMGMCFGVRDALKAIGRIERPSDVTIHGRLVHNEVVSDDLQARGFLQTAEEDREGLPSTKTVLITAHGVSDRERKRLSDAGKNLIDTTCPLVKRAHDAAKRLSDEGYFVLVIGRRDHVEVRGIVEDLQQFEVVESLEGVRMYPSLKLGIVCQTTTAERSAERIRDAVRFENPGAEIRVVDTICLPTKEHQRSVERLIDRVEAMVIVGGRHSNNTKELTRLCRERGLRAFQIACVDELESEWFDGVETVGLTAGTSTLDSTIDKVEAALRRMSSRPALTSLYEDPQRRGSERLSDLSEVGPN